MRGHAAARGEVRGDQAGRNELRSFQKISSAAAGIALMALQINSAAPLDAAGICRPFIANLLFRLDLRLVSYPKTVIVLPARPGKHPPKL